MSLVDKMLILDTKGSVGPFQFIQSQPGDGDGGHREHLQHRGEPPLLRSPRGGAQRRRHPDEPHPDEEDGGWRLHGFCQVNRSISSIKPI